MSQPYTGTGDLLLLLYSPGDRIELCPSTDRWIRGDRFGEVESIGRRYVSVRMDRSRKLIRVSPENIYRKLEA